ncbi:MAG: hypothetical protein FWC86_03510 [Coriobacteriia bacterium]|nr:hypothetical protein [Coriobacteriia bacterium]
MTNGNETLQTEANKATQGSQRPQSQRDWVWPALLAALGLISGLLLMMRFPPVVGLGSLVRLPVFHGALTWASFILFFLLGVVGLWAFFSQKESLYTWSKSLRYSVIALWILNFAMGIFAATLTWDFSGTTEPAITWMAQEPRIRLQFAVSMIGIAILILPLIFEKWRIRALFDGVYGFLTLIMVYIALNFGQSLHPSNPAMSSEESIIRHTFLLMCVALSVMCSGIVILVKTLISRKASKSAT